MNALRALVGKTWVLLCGSAIKEECGARLSVCRWRHCIASVHTRLALFLDGPASALRVRAQVCGDLLLRILLLFISVLCICTVV